MRPGYKQTEIGVIPEDWEVITLGSVCRPGGLVRGPFGGALKKEFFVKQGYKVYEQRNAIYATIELGNYFVDSDKYKELARFRLVPGDFIVSCSGTIGRIFRIPENAPEGNINQALLKITVDSNVIDGQFFLFLFRWDPFQEKIIDNSHGGAMQNLVGMDIFRNIQIQLPSLQEQWAIAAALSDVDGLLAGLDRLIAKKRAVKTAVMQQLLTGEVRVGEGNGWKEYTLKQVAEIQPGINKPISEMGAGTLYVTVQDLYDGISIPVDKLGRIRLSPNEILSKSLIADDIVFGKSSVKREGIGYPSIFLGCVEPVVCSGFTYRVRAYQEIANPTFLFYSLRASRTRQWVIDNSQASALTNLNQSIADAIPILLPPPNEQRTIATILSDIDAEIAALAARRAKTAAVKQGMMQELLTGRTRLA